MTDQTKIYTYSDMMKENKLDPETGHYCGWKGMATHRRFHRQFVNQSQESAILAAIGEAALLASRDPHFNDIPLEKWDRLPRIINKEKVKELGGNLSLSTFTCVNKEAARLWIEKNAPHIHRYRASYEYSHAVGDPRHEIRTHAIGVNEADAMENLLRLNKQQIWHKLHGLAPEGE